MSGELLRDCDAARPEEVLVGGRVDEPRVRVAVHERVDLQLRLVERVLQWANGHFGASEIVSTGSSDAGMGQYG